MDESEGRRHKHYWPTCGAIRVGYRPEGAQRRHDEPLASLPHQAETRFKYVMNASQKRYRCAKLFASNHPDTDISLNFSLLYQVHGGIHDQFLLIFKQLGNK